MSFMYHSTSRKLELKDLNTIVSAPHFVNSHLQPYMCQDYKEKSDWSLDNQMNFCIFLEGDFFFCMRLKKKPSSQ